MDFDLFKRSNKWIIIKSRIIKELIARIIEEVFMDILVSTLAKLYGLSNQTLHYYEDKNILTPKRDIMNDYRYYDAADLNLLGSIKKYRNAEFSLKETIQLCNDSNDQDIISKYSKQKESLLEEIKRKQCIVDQLEESIALYNRYQETKNSMLVEELEGFLRFESKEREIIFQDQEMRKEATPWFKNVFHTNGSKMFYIDRETNKILKSVFGMLATFSTARHLNLKITENVKKIPAGKFLTLIIDPVCDKSIEREILHCLDYIHRCHNLNINGNPFVRSIFMHMENSNERKNLCQIIIPVLSKDC